MSDDNRIRILHVITRMDPGGSTDDTLLTLAGLDPTRFRAALASGPAQDPPGAGVARARENGVAFVDIPDLVRDISPLRDLRSLVALWRLMRRERYHIVHTHTSKAGFVGRLAARLAGVPIIVHKPHGHVFYGYYGPLLTRLFILLERWAARVTDRIITLSQRGADEHVAVGVGRPGMFVTIPSGVDFSAAAEQTIGREEVRRALGIGADDLVVGTLGRLTAIKGQGDLVEAFAGLDRRNGGPWLLLVGDGEERVALQRRAQELGAADRVVFAGWRDDIYNLLRAMDIFALPSWNEGMGKALVEAMYVGIPPVVTAVGGVPEIVDDGETGLLVPARRPDRMREALAELAADPDRRRGMGRAAAERAQAYSIGRALEMLVDLYSTLVEEKGFAPPLA